MFFDPECIPCIIKQAYNAGKLFTNGNKELQLKIVKEACTAVLSVNENFTAPMFSSTIQALVEKNIGVINPYHKLKEENLKKAKRFIKYLEMMVENSDDKLEMAIRTAILGNTIDLGANPNFDIEFEVNRITANDINQDNLKSFSKDLNKSSLILYIGDNFEEALFDKILIKQLLPKKIVFAVRSKPILNDITLADAKILGLDKICDVIESGSTIAGTNLSECTGEFLDLFNNADLVISKGQGNFETLLNEVRPIYFLFKVKCESIANRCGLNVGASALYLNRKKKEENEII
ncbi:MAG TPA: ARMT1-like domain-containing protein [Ignavibacteriaceae bacterium]|nr:ARMT1-like domain-containing protein [Ignavibacteriaceae bacterium]